MKTFKNQDIYLEEVTRAIDRTNLSSAPSPEEKVFSILIKKGGDNMAAALLHVSVSNMLVLWYSVRKFQA